MSSTRNRADHDGAADVEALAAETLLREEGSADVPVPPAAPRQSTPPPAADVRPRVRKVKIEYRARRRRFTLPSRIIISPGVAAAVLAVVVGGVWVALGAAFGKNPLYGLAPLLAGVARLIAAVRGEPEP